MMKYITPLICALGLLAILPHTNHAQAELLIINDQTGQSVITGTISDIRYDTIELVVDSGDTITVKIDNLDLDEDEFDEYFSAGQKIKVIGDFDNGEIDANQIIREETSDGVLIAPELN